MTTMGLEGESNLTRTRESKAASKRLDGALHSFIHYV